MLPTCAGGKQPLSQKWLKRGVDLHDRCPNGEAVQLADAAAAKQVDAVHLHGRSLSVTSRDIWIASRLADRKCRGIQWHGRPDQDTFHALCCLGRAPFNSTIVSSRPSSLVCVVFPQSAGLCMLLQPEFARSVSGNGHGSTAKGQS